MGARVEITGMGEHFLYLLYIWMSFTIQFNCKQNEKHNLSSYLILDRIRDTKIINGKSGIRMSKVDFYKKLISGGSFIRDSRVYYERVPVPKFTCLKNDHTSVQFSSIDTDTFI